MIRELIDTDLEAVAGGFDVNQYLYNYQTNSLTQSASATSSGDSSPATAVNAVGALSNSASQIAVVG